MKITFLGGAGNVTGSRHLLETGGRLVLVDCGLYQERDLKTRNWDPFPVSPSSIDAIVLTHAHIDHCGYLPRLVKDGFRGVVCSTQVTAEVARIVLEDSAKLQVEDVEFKNKRHRKEQRTVTPQPAPLYNLNDVNVACSLMKGVPYDRDTGILDGVVAVFRDAGHILGSSSVELRVRENGEDRTIVFSGDIGRCDRPILRDPLQCPPCDYLLVESTYGDRIHEGSGNTADQLAEVINRTAKRGGNVVIPSFAIERAHELLYYLNELLAAGRIPRVPVVLDSPMAVRVVEVFRRHAEIVDEDMKRLLKKHRSPFSFAGLEMTATADESKALNRRGGTSVIIAGAGMCNGGRIKHHLVSNISKPQATVLFVGYQAIGTLGRIIADGAGQVRIFGEMREVKAQVEQLHGFSAHADRIELQSWLSGLAGKAPRKTFVVHGEPDASRVFGDELHRNMGFDVAVPAYMDSAELT